MKKNEPDPASALVTSPCEPPQEPNPSTEKGNSVPLYHKCLDCAEYGITCNRAKLEAIADIGAVRDFHRKLRAKRGIHLKQLYAAAYPVSESTINEYFSKEPKDFKWTTVACIDNALMAICGNRVGLPPLVLPCPTSAGEMQAQILKYATDLEALREENHALQQKVAEVKGKVIAVREEVKADFSSRVVFLRDLCEKRQHDVEELKHQAADYLQRIDEKNRRLDILSRRLRLTMLIAVVLLILLTCYVVWDISNIDAGFFRFG